MKKYKSFIIILLLLITYPQIVTADKEDLMGKIQKKMQTLNLVNASVALEISGETDILINADKVYQSASVIKIFIAYVVYQQVNNGRIKLNQEVVLKTSDKVGGAGSLSAFPGGYKINIESLVRKMLVESDNTATNMLIDLIGMQNINLYFRQLGFIKTVIQRKMMDWSGIKQGKDNYITAYETMLMMRLIATRQQPFCQKIIDNLLIYEDKTKIPKYLKGIDVANKSGELPNGIWHDAAIIYTARPYILVILTQSGSNEKIAKLSKYIFDLLKKED